MHKRKSKLLKSGFANVVLNSYDKLNKISKTYCTITCNDVLCIRFACVAQLVAQLIRNQ